jgi:DNA-binding MarR family transcriptional regulator
VEVGISVTDGHIELFATEMIWAKLDCAQSNSPCRKPHIGSAQLDCLQSIGNLSFLEEKTNRAEAAMEHDRPNPARDSAGPGAEKSALALSNQLCFSIYSAAHAFNATYKSLLEPLGLTYPQYLVMLVLWERDNLSLKAIGERLGLDSGTLTPLLKRLEAAGLLERRRDPLDERHRRILLTPLGQALKEKARAVPPQVLAASGLSLDQLFGLKRQIDGLTESLQAEAAETAAGPDPAESQPADSHREESR